MIVNLKIDSLKKIIILSLLIFSIPVLSTTTTPASGIADWSIKTVATDPYQVRPSITVDASGSPHISYVSPDGIIYAYRSGETWNKEVVNSAADYAEYELPIENHPGVKLSFDSPRIALDSVGNPNIAHLTKLVQCSDRFCTFWWVRLAAKSGDNWTDQILLQDSLAGGFSNLRFAVDPVDRLHVTALAYDGVGVMYSPYSDSLPWNFTAVPFIDATGSIAADASGTPHICGQPRSNGGLAYTHRYGVNWIYESIDLSVSLGGCSIAVESSGNPHIIFSNNANQTRWYAVKSNSSWEIEPVAANIGADAQLILDALSNPHILYTDASTGDLKYAVKSGGNWVIETVDTGTDMVWGPSFALDRDGNPHITYLDNKTLSLKYVTTKDHSTAKPKVVDVSTLNIRDEGYQSVFASTDTVRVNVNVNGSDQPIKDIRLTVMDANGRVVLSATPLTKSNDDGDYSYFFYDYVLVSLPPGDYDALVTVAFSDGTTLTGFNHFKRLRPVAATGSSIPWINGT